MKEMNKIRHKKTAYFGIYTAVFSVCILLVFSDFWRYGRTLIWKQDGISQYFPRAVYYAEYIRTFVSNLLQGRLELPMYDFSLGMGAEVTYSLEPLYFLFALFGEEHAELAYQCITVIRFYLAGITVSILCLYFKKGYFETLIAGMIYVFCSFALYGGARHTMFMIPMILLPLLILAIEEILREKRWYLCTIFVAVSLLSNYYYLYMNTIAMGIYFVVRFLCQREKEKKTVRNFVRKGLVICGTYLLGVAMSCIVLVTTFGQYVGSSRNGSAIIKTPSLFYYSKEWLVRCFLSFLTTANSPGEWLKLGFLPIAFAAVVCLFARKGKKEIKILSVIALILMSFPIFGFIFSGFSFVQNRWCYMIALLVAYITAAVWPELFDMTRREVLILAAAVGLYGYLAYFGNYLTTKYTKLAFLCLTVTFGAVLLCQKRIKKLPELLKKGLILCLCMAMVLVNGHTFFGTAGAVQEYAAPGEAAKKSIDTPLAAVSQLEDDSFYRCEALVTSFHALSASLQLGYNGVSVFNSTINGYIMEYLSEMGCTSFGGTTIYGLDNRTFLNALAAVKYCGYYEGDERTLPYGYEEVLRTEQNKKTAVICENKYALPFGYTYKETITREELEQYSAVERQEVLMQKVLLEAEAAKKTETKDSVFESGSGEEGAQEKSKAEDSIFGSGSGEESVQEKSETEDPVLKSGSGEEDAQEKMIQEETMEIQITSQELEILSVEEQGVKLTETSMTADASEEHLLTLTFESRPDSETYLVLENGFLEGDGSEEPINLFIETEGNSYKFRFRAEDDRYGTGQKDFVLNLGYHEDVLTSCTIKMSRAGSIEFSGLKLYSQSMENVESYTQARKEAVLEEVCVENNSVSGRIALEEEKILVLSIPYQKGWTAYVDGEKTEIKRANGMYMGLPLTAGEHSVELKFEIPGMRYVLVITPCAVVLFTGLLTVSAIRRKRKQSTCVQ